jgi:perosamine synthetase
MLKGKTMDLEMLISNKNSTIKEALHCIDKNSMGATFVVEDDRKLVGVLTDGDIRRLLIDGYGLNDYIESLINRDFVYAYSYEKSSDIVSKFNDAIRIIPIVDKAMKLVDYAVYNEKIHISLAQPQLNGNEYKYLMDAFLSTWISSTGKYVTSFEEGFSKYCGRQYGVATSNGTTALHLALTALGIGAGDEVIVPDITFAATINSVIYTGATPVIVDIEEDSWCIDPAEVEKAITPRTKAIIPVHIYGQPCDMGKICEIAKKHNLYIVEDCAEAHGAEWDGRKVGSFGVISCFSFFGNKVITTGEGGMCVTDSSELNDKLRVLRDHGMSKQRKYYHEVIGFNYRLTNMQAAIGTAQVERIDSILAWREDLEEQYRAILSKVDGVTMQRNNLPKHKKITWLISMLVSEDKRDKVISMLKENDIDVRAFFIPLSKMEIYKKYAKRNCPVSNRISKMGINLPTTYEIDIPKIEKIAAIIEKTLS